MSLIPDAEPAYQWQDIHGRFVNILNNRERHFPPEK